MEAHKHNLTHGGLNNQTPTTTAEDDINPSIKHNLTHGGLGKPQEPLDKSTETDNKHNLTHGGLGKQKMDEAYIKFMELEEDLNKIKTLLHSMKRYSSRTGDKYITESIAIILRIIG